MKKFPRGYAREVTRHAGRAPKPECHPESLGTPGVRDLLGEERGLGPTLVLLPGLDGTGELFTPFLQSLDGPHLLLQANPEESARVVTAFVKSIDSNIRARS